jgi:hypothetical protein
MAANILTENSILVYDFVPSRSKIPFEKINRVHHVNDAPASLFACSGETFQKDEPKTLSHSVNKNQSMRQRRIGLEFFQILLWALVFGHYFNINQPNKKKKHPSRRRSYAHTLICQKHD